MIHRHLYFILSILKIITMPQRPSVLMNLSHELPRRHLIINAILVLLRMSILATCVLVLI